MGVALYVIAQFYGYISEDSIIKTTVKCKYCRKQISEKVGGSVARGRKIHVLIICLGETLRQLHELAGWKGRCVIGREIYMLDVG